MKIEKVDPAYGEVIPAPAGVTSPQTNVWDGHRSKLYVQPGQLRPLQRRVRGWRQAMARELIYTGAAKEGKPEKVGHVDASEEEETVPLSTMDTLSGVPLYVGEAG